MNASRRTGSICPGSARAGIPGLLTASGISRARDSDLPPGSGLSPSGLPGPRARSRFRADLLGLRVLAALVLVALVPVLSLAVSLTILHTNDTHGHLLPFSYPSIVDPGSAESDLSTRSDIGGIARRATLVRQIRRELGAKGIPVWLIDSGDICDGSPFSTEYHGEADVAAMNSCGYDFATLGNHEFNNTLDQLHRLISQAKYRILCANVEEKSTGKPLVPPSAVENVGGLRLGLFGLVTHESASYPAAREGVDIKGEIETARKLVAELRPQSDVIVLISHCGKAVDEKIAAEVPGIDVILGGHSHSRIPVGELLWHSDDLVADDVNGTVIVQAFQWGGELGRLDLLFEKDAQGVWRLDRYRDRLIPITASLPADSAVGAVVDHYWKPIATRYGEVIGTAAADFADRGDDLAEYNLVADAVRETVGADFELENLGGVRAPLIQGPITLGDIMTVDPFEDTVVTFKMSGRDLKRLLAEEAPAVSGIRYRLMGRHLIEATLDGHPLEDDRLYQGASNSYFAAHALKNVPCADTGRLRSAVVTDYIRKKGTLEPAYDGRRVVLEGE